MKIRFALVVGAIAIVAVACGGGRTTPTVDESDGGSGGGSGGDAAAIAEGKTIYDANCVACHAEGGVGIDGLGKPLVGSEFVASLTDEELVQFIIVGRDTSDPLNDSGVAMPARGGNPNLTDSDIEFVVAYLRSIN